MASRNRQDEGFPTARGSRPRSTDPSLLDRRRLESDVRYFLRSPSVPWISFDRDSRSTWKPTPGEPIRPQQQPLSSIEVVWPADWPPSAQADAVAKPVYVPPAVPEDPSSV